MRIDATGISKGRAGVPLPATDVSYESGSVTVTEAEGGDRPVVLALIASGRMHPDTGEVTLDDTADPVLLRERIALVDAPEVSEPAPDLRLGTVVREELAYANRITSRAAVEQAITDAVHANEEAGLAPETRTPRELARIPVRDIPPALRIRLLAELAVSRPGVEGIVLTLPDRHGGSPTDWHTIALDLAARDLAVLAVTGRASAELLALTGSPTSQRPTHDLSTEADA